MSKKVGIMQPYFVPYIGYWQLLNAVDEYVIYDDVNFIKGGWINRNRILVNGNPTYFNIPMLGASSFKLINEIGVNQDEKLIKKFYSTLKSQLNETSYSNYKLSKEARHLIIKLFLSYQKDNINDINNTLSEIEPTEDFNSFNYNYLSNKDEQTVDYNKESTNKIKGYSTLDDEHIFSDKNTYGIKDKNEIAKILYWKKAKIVLTLIFVTLVIVSFISIPILFKRISKN